MRWASTDGSRRSQRHSPAPHTAAPSSRARSRQICPGTGIANSALCCIRLTWNDALAVASEKHITKGTASRNTTGDTVLPSSQSEAPRSPSSEQIRVRLAAAVLLDDVRSELYNSTSCRRAERLKAETANLLAPTRLRSAWLRRHRLARRPEIASLLPDGC